ncbi:MAG: hypothetical protein VW736_02875 [Alphaproteobacteria bacterium]
MAMPAVRKAYLGREG